MLPVERHNYLNLICINKLLISKMLRLERLRNQLHWLTGNKKEVLTKSRLLYKLYKNKKLPKNIIGRCCNFPLLEEKCKEYNRKKIEIQN